MNIRINPLMAPVGEAPSGAAPTAPAPEQGNFQRVVDSDAVTAGSLQDGFMKATGDGPARRRGRDTPMPNEPLQTQEGNKASTSEPAKPASKIVDPMDAPVAPEPAKADPKPEPKIDPKPDATPSKEQNIRVLATERDRFKSENETLRKQLVEAQEYRKQTEDYPKVKETLAQREQRLEEMEHRLRQTNYKESEEYRDKWLKPMETAYKRAVGSLKEFQIEIPGTPDEYDNPGKPTFRAATEDDFAYLYNLTEGAAWRESRKMFGDAAPAIMQHRSGLKQIEEGARNAAEEYRTNGRKMEQEETAKRVSQQQEMEGMWEKENTRITETMPKILKDRADDNEHNSVLESSRNLVDTAYSEARKSMAPKERVALDARVRSRAIAYGPMMLEIQRLREQLSEAQGRAKTLSEGEPGVPSTGRTQVDAVPKSLEEHFFAKTK